MPLASLLLPQSMQRGVLVNGKIAKDGGSGFLDVLLIMMLIYMIYDMICSIDDAIYFYLTSGRMGKHLTTF